MAQPVYIGVMCCVVAPRAKVHSVVDKPVLLPGVCLWEYVCDTVS